MPLKHQEQIYPEAGCRSRVISASAPPCLRVSVVKGQWYAAIAIVLVLVAGCGSSGGAASDGAADRPAVARRGRTQMWADNCNRCHNARPASWYAEREWEVSMHHMQVRGYLTGEETRAITEFFRASR
jgi:hypothetical protein